MIDYIKQHYQFALMLIIWAISGIYANPLHLAVIPASLLLLKNRGMYIEMICGLFFILVLSDSWSPAMLWAGNVKDIYLVMLAAFFFFNQKEFPQKNTLFYSFIPYFLLAAALLLRSPEIGTAFQKTLSYILVFTVLPPYYNKVLAEDGSRFVKGLTYTAAALLIYGFLLIIINYDAAYLVGRFRGVMGNPNGLGLFCTVFFAFFTITLSKFKNLFSRNEIIFIYAIILISVILTGSRNTLLSIMIFYGFSRFFSISYWLGFTLIIIIAITYQVVITNLPEIIAALGLEEYMRVEHLEDGSGRIVAWIFAWGKIQENFLLGRGFNYEGWLFIQNQDFLYTLGHIGNSHNSYLAIWLNTGLIGLILFMYALIYRFVKTSSRSAYALPLMYSTIFSATFEAWFVGSLNPHTPLLLLMWTLMMIDARDESPVEITTYDKYKIPSFAS